MKIKQAGFTLIELIIVIVILGILAVTVAPKFIDIRTEAEGAVLESVSSSLKAANTLTYAKALIQDQVTLENGSVDLGNSITATTRYGYLSFADTNLSGVNLMQILNIDICHFLNSDGLCKADGSTEFLYDVDFVAGVGIIRIFSGKRAGSNLGPDTDQIECRIDYYMPSAQGVLPRYDVLLSEC